jgi:glycyl-tRNA synthetase beta subunit
MQEEKYIECINKIKELIGSYNFDFTIVKKNLPEKEKRLYEVVKRIEGIIKYATNENAQQKIENVNRYLNALKTKLNFK